MFHKAVHYTSQRWRSLGPLAWHSPWSSHTAHSSIFISWSTLTHSPAAHWLTVLSWLKTDPIIHSVLHLLSIISIMITQLISQFLNPVISMVCLQLMVLTAQLTQPEDKWVSRIAQHDFTGSLKSSWYQWLYCWGWPCAHSMQYLQQCHYAIITEYVSTGEDKFYVLTPIDIIQAQVSISHSTTWWTVVVLETRRQWSRGVAPQEGTVLGNWPCTMHCVTCSHTTVCV